MGQTFSLLTAALIAAQTPATPTAPSTCPCQKNNNVSTVGYVQPVPAEVAQGSGTTSRVMYQNEATPEPRPGFFGRIQNLFRKKEAAPETQVPSYTSEPPVESKRLFQRLPEGNKVTPAQSFETIPTAAPQSLPAAPVKIVTPINYQNSTQPSLAIPTTSSASTSYSAPVAATSTPTVAAVAPTNPTRPNKISPDLVSKVGHAEDFSWITGQIRIENGVHILHYATPETVDRYEGHVVLTSEKDLRTVPEGAYVCVRGNVAQQAGNRTIYRVQALDILTANR